MITVAVTRRFAAGAAVAVALPLLGWAAMGAVGQPSGAGVRPAGVASAAASSGAVSDGAVSAQRADGVPAQLRKSTKAGWDYCFIVAGKSTDTSVQLVWERDCTSLKIKVQLFTRDGGGDALAKGLMTADGYTFTGLQPGTTYWWAAPQLKGGSTRRPIATLPAGTTTPSPTGTETPTPTSRPSTTKTHPPVDACSIQAGPSTTTSVRLVWVWDCTSLKIKVSLYDSRRTDRVLARGVMTEDGLTFDNLRPGKTYYWLADGLKGARRPIQTLPLTTPTITSTGTPTGTPTSTGTDGAASR